MTAPHPVTVIIAGPAVPKGRARMTRRGVAYTPAKTRKYEAHGRLAAQLAMDGRPPLDEKPPKWSAACGYHVVEADLPHFYLNGMTAAQWEKHATDVAEEFVRRHPGSSQKNIRVIPK